MLPAECDEVHHHAVMHKTPDISMNDRLVLFGTKGGPRLIKGGSWPTFGAENYESVIHADVLCLMHNCMMMNLITLSWQHAISDTQMTESGQCSLCF